MQKNGTPQRSCPVWQTSGICIAGFLSILAIAWQSSEGAPPSYFAPCCALYFPAWARGVGFTPDRERRSLP